MSDPIGNDSAERRTRQRFVARRRGAPCFWALLGDARIALNDLSMEGFALQCAMPPALGVEQAVVLQREGVPDEIRGRAVVVNHIARADGGVAGFRFVGLDGDGAERLQDWLVAHVIMNASVRISEKEATEIVLGRSLI